MVANKGFSLLEIIITLLLTAIILTAVMQVAFRATQQDAFAKKHVSKDVKLIVMHTQFLQDISGLCSLVYEHAEKSEEKSEKSAKPAEKQDNKQSDDIKKYFYSVQKDNHLDVLTFVTTHSLTFYGQDPKPLIRVTYTLAPGKDENSGFSLLRKETTTLAFEEAEKSGKYAVLLDGIKKFETTYFYVKPKKEEKTGSEKGGKKSEKEELPELAAQKDWGMQQPDEKEPIEQKIPSFILIQCECENGLKQDFWYEVLSLSQEAAQVPKMTPSKKGSEKESEKSSEGGAGYA